MASADTETASAPPPHRGWLNRNVLCFGLTSLLADMGYESATAILPAYLTALGAPAWVLGFMEGAADALSSFTKLASGWFSDRLPRRKPLVVAGYGLSALAGGLMALAIVWPLVVLLRVAAWFGKGLRNPPRNALLAESVTPGARGKAFGFHRAGDTVGAILGPMLAALLLRAWSDAGGDVEPFQYVLLAAFVPGLAAVACVAWGVREAPRAVLEGRPLHVLMLALPADYRRFLLAIGVFGAGDFSHSLLILAATSLLKPAYGFTGAAQVAMLLFALHNAAGAAAAYPIGALGDRWGRRGLLIGVYFLGAGVSALFGAALLGIGAGAPLLALGFALAGAVQAGQEALESALAADYVPNTAARGVAYGVLGAVNGVGDFISSTIVGLCWTVAPALGFGYAVAMMLAGAVLLARRPRRG